MADGEVVFSIRGDDSQFGEDLDKAEKKADSKLSKIGSVAGTAAKATGAAFAAIGSAALAAGAKAISGATELDKAMNQFAASTGAAEDKLSSYEDTIKKIYANNYGESFEDIAEAMSQIRTQIGPVVDYWDPSALQSFTESAFVLRDTFGYEINESVRAANTLMNQFGTDGQDAFELIATAAQNGLDFSDELLDSINEYSVHFGKLGMDADDMFKIMEAGAQNGAFNLDKIGDAIKELSIRVVDGSDTTTEGFAAIGLDAEKMAKAFAAGGDSAKKHLIKLYKRWQK